jgi:hypothetical protein
MKVETLYKQTVRELDSLWTGQGSGLPENATAVALPTTATRCLPTTSTPVPLRRPHPGPEVGAGAH